MTKPGYNRFDLTHDVKLSCNMGQLIPICVMDLVPGDKVNIGCESLIRFAPLIAPVMHRMDVTMHYFFVPNRILWESWEQFITQQGGEPFSPSSELPAFPFVTISESNYGGSGSLADYLGIPTPIGENTEDVNALPFLAYQKIWNEYYRDQNLQESTVDTANNGDNTANFNVIGQLRRRAWEHDYYTAALPFAQRGAAVDIPLGDVKLKDLDNTRVQGGLWKDYQNENSAVDGTISADNITGAARAGNSGGGSNRLTAYDPNGTLETGATTINDLRRAYALQRWLEKAARGGSRYIENILVNFGIKSSDKRLQRPEYITGIKSPVVISEILNTTGTDTLPQGNMAGHGISVTSGKYGRYFAEEHGYVIGVMSIMPKTAYQQGLDKHWLKIVDPTQYYWPDFAHIGEQEVLKKEVYAFQGDAGNNTFGYVPRYAEYKFMQNRVAGDFRTNLDFWHMGRIFDGAPNLNGQFITCEPDDRQFAVEDPGVQKLYCHVLNKISMARMMPKFGTPTF